MFSDSTSTGEDFYYTPFLIHAALDASLYLARLINNTLPRITASPIICKKEIFSEAKKTPSKTATTGFT